MFGDIQPVDPPDEEPVSCPERGHDTGTPMGRGPHANTPSSVPVDPWVVRPGANQHRT